MNMSLKQKGINLLSCTAGCEGSTEGSLGCAVIIVLGPICYSKEPQCGRLILPYIFQRHGIASSSET
jgi:hypothetical protein